VGWALLGLIVVLTLGVAALAWKATNDSISLDFLRGRIEAAVRSRLPPDAIVSIGQTAFSFRRDQGLILRARDVELALPGRATVNTGELSTTTTATAALSGEIELRSVAVSGVEVGISAIGGLSTGGTGAEMVRNAALAFVAQIQAADELMRGAGLEEVSVRNAALRVIDHAGRPGPALRIAEANWTPLAEARSKAWLQVVGEGGSWDLTVERRRGRLGGGSVMVEVEELPIEALAPNLASAAAGEPFYRHAALTVMTRISTGRDGSLSGLRGTVSTGGGQLSLTGKDRIEVAATTLSYALGPNGERINFPHGEIATGTGNLAFEGVADLSEAGQVTVLARVRGGALPSAAGQQTVRLTGGGALARFSFADRSLAVERFHLVAPEGRVSAVGQIGFGEAAPGVSFALSMTEMPATVARAFWPPFVAAKTRTWFDENVRSGLLGPATLQVALPPDHLGVRGRDKILPPSGLVGILPFRDGVVSPIPELPVLRNTAGDITFGDATAIVRLQSGVIGIPGRGDLDVVGTELVIPELGKKSMRGDLHLQLSGPASALAALAGTPPLNVSREHGIEPDALSGGAKLALAANIPLEDGSIADVLPMFRLELNDFSSAVPLDGRLVQEADLVLEGSPQSYTITGEGLLDGMEASVDLTLGSAAAEQTDVVLSLDEEARARLGLDFGEMLKGPVEAAISTSEDGSQRITLDLKDARVTASALGWEKGPGVPATAEFVLKKSATGTDVSDIVLSGKGFGAKGSLSLGADGALRQLDLTELALRPGDRLAATIRAEGSGYDVKLSGASLDVRGLLRGLSGKAARASSGGKGGASRIRVSLDLGEVRGQDDVVLADVSGSLVLNGSALDRANVKGRVAEGEAFEWTLGREDGTRILRVFAENGGALFRFAGIYSKIAGGNLILDYSGPLGGTGSGMLVMRDFRVVNEAALEPAVESARRATTDQGLRPAADSSRDLRFSQIKVPFRQQGWVITIEDAALRGPMIGATGNGTVNIPDRRIAISGSLIPAFGINNIAGAIPLIGTILGGGRDEGLVGITYKLFGPLDAPKLTMNPISAIAPGIFRKIFEYN
jgi:hypothetical protein